MKIEIQLYMGLKALATFIILLSIVFPFGVLSKYFLRNIVLFLKFNQRFLDLQITQERSITFIHIHKCIWLRTYIHFILTQDSSYTHLQDTM